MASHLAAIQACVYCGDLKNVKFLTNLPSAEKVQLKWQQILGPEYTYRSRTQDSPMICMNHFENIDHSTVPRVLPYRNENLLNIEIYEAKLKSSRISIGDQPGTSYSQFPDENKNLWRGQIRSYDDYYQVQQSRKRPRFLLKMEEELQKQLRIEFPTPGPNLPPLQINPVTRRISAVVQAPAFEENHPRFQCCYCQCIQYQIEQMVDIPNNLQILEIWKKHLGMEFENNLRVPGFWPYLICKNHFKLDEKGQIVEGFLPCPFKRSEVTIGLKNIRNVKIEEPFEQMMNAEIAPSNIRRQIKEECQDFEFDQKPTVLKKQKNSPISEMVKEFEESSSSNNIQTDDHHDNNLVSIKQESQDSDMKKEDRRLCVYCKVLCPIKQMTRVPKNPEIVEKWAEVLGMEFKCNYQLYSCPFICLVHFEDGDKPRGWKWNTVPVANGINQEAMSEERKFRRGRLGILPFSTCIYCGKRCLQKLMEKTPENDEKLQEWIRLLGKEFETNYRNSTDPSFVCLTHFGIF